MPARYEAIRDRYVEKLLREHPDWSKKRIIAEAKKHAARIFNASRKRGEAPVTGHGE